MATEWELEVSKYTTKTTKVQTVVPSSVLREFKALCILRGVSMKQRIAELMEQDVKKRKKPG